jgi:hypothetical protein
LVLPGGKITVIDRRYRLVRCPGAAVSREGHAKGKVVVLVDWLAASCVPVELE